MVFTVVIESLRLTSKKNSFAACSLLLLSANGRKDIAAII